MSSSHHVGLEQGALQVDMVVRQGLVDSSQDLLSNILAALQVMVTIGEDLRLNDGDNAVLRKAGTTVKMTMLTNTNSREMQFGPITAGSRLGGGVLLYCFVIF